MIDVCQTADAMARMDKTIDEGCEYGDKVYEIVHRLRSTAVLHLGPHNTREHQAIGVPAEMTEFY